MWVGPKRVMTGVPNAAAKWRGPESVVISRADRRTQAFDQPEAERLVGQADHPGWPAEPAISRAALARRARRRPAPRRPPPSRAAGPGSANDADRASSSPGRTPRRYSGRRPARPAGQSQLDPGAIGGRLVVGGRDSSSWSESTGQPAAGPAPGNTRRSASAGTGRSASRGGWRRSVSSEPAASLRVADPPRDPGEPGDQAERNELGSRTATSAASRAAGGRPPASAGPVRAIGGRRGSARRTRGAVEHRGDVRADRPPVSSPRRTRAAGPGRSAWP